MQNKLVKNCYLFLIIILLPITSYSEPINFIPDIYGSNLLYAQKNINFNYNNESKVFNNLKILENKYLVCLNNKKSDIISFLANKNITIDLYKFIDSNKETFTCFLNKPGESILEKNKSSIFINLNKKDIVINLNPTFKDLLNSENYKSNNLDISIPQYSTTDKSYKNSLPSSYLFCSDDQVNLTNKLLDINQPIKLKSSLFSINKIGYLNESYNFAKALKTSYKPLSKVTKSIPNPNIYDVVINKDFSKIHQDIIYYESSIVCLTNEQIISLNINPDHDLFYEYFIPNSDPLIDSSLKCLVDNKNNVTVNVNKNIIYINIPYKKTISQNINLGSTNEPIYPTDNSILNSTSYQINNNQNNQNGVNNYNINGTILNTTSFPIGSLINSFSGSSSQINRNYSYWQSDFPLSMTSLVLGETNPMIGSWGGTMSYAGIQYGSNQNLRPNVFFTATPILSGYTNTPTTAQILLNGSQTNQIDVNSGNFNIYNLPIMNGDGSITVNLKGINGDSQSYTLPYYSTPKVLNDTTYLYQYNVGLPKNYSNNGLDFSNYQSNSLMGAMQHYIGITNQYTLELRSEAQSGNNQFANLGISHNMIWLNSFATGLSTAISQSESGTGTLLGFNFSRQSSLPNSFGFGYNANLFSNNFNQLGLNQGQNYQLQQTIFSNYNWNSFNIALGYSNYSYFDNSSATELYNMTLNWQFFRNFLLTSSTSITNQTGSQSIGSNLGLTITFDNSSTLNTNYNYQNINGINSNTYLTNYQYGDSSNIWGYNVGGEYNDTDMSTPTGINAGGYYLFKNFNLNTQAGYKNSSNYSSLASISGNAVISSNGLNLGQYSNLSYIIVKVGDLKNIGIKQNGTIIGSTDRNGSFVIPNISPYLPQDIEVNSQDLPFNTELDSYSKRVVAPLNGGAKVIFIPVTYTPASLYIRYEGKTPSAGLVMELFNKETNKKIDELITTDNGYTLINKYSPEINYIIRFRSKLGNYSCEISRENINFKDSNEYLTSLGIVNCSK